jgi:hypothetical protein
MDFVMNGAIEIFIIGTSAYIIAGSIMRSFDQNLGIWFGKKGGTRLWLITALSISGLYHWVIEIFS